MKKTLMMIFAVALAGCATKPAQPSAAQPAPTTVTNAAPADAATNAPASVFKSDKEKIGYALGLNLGNNLVNSWKRQGLQTNVFDLDTFTQGLKDVLSGNKPLLTPQETRATLIALQQAVMQQRKQQAALNLAASEKFLADNKAKPGVTTLPDGLQYKVISEGSGDSPKASDTVTVNYRGTLVDGTEFDSSFKHGQPATFHVGGVIRGWTEALQLMKPGAKWQIYIPASLAYGEAGSPPVIPPNSTLIFDVELISIAAAPSGPPMPPMGQPVTSDIIRVPSADELKHGAKIETIPASQLQQYTNSTAK